MTSEWSVQLNFLKSELLHQEILTSERLSAKPLIVMGQKLKGHATAPQLDLCPDFDEDTPKPSLVSPWNIFQQVLGTIKMSCGKCETSICVLLDQQWFLPCKLSHEYHFCLVLWLNHEGKWGLLCCKCCYGFFCGLLDESLMHSWSDFCWLATPGKDHCSVFLPFVDKGLALGMTL